MPFQSLKQQRYVMAKMRYWNNSPYTFGKKYPERANSEDFAIVRSRDGKSYRPRVYVFGRTGKLKKDITFPVNHLYKMNPKGKPVLR